MEDIAQATKSEPLLKNTLISENKKSIAIRIGLIGSEDLATRAKQGPESVRFVRKIAQEYGLAYPEMRFRLVGSLMFNQVNMEATYWDMASLIPAFFALMVILLYLLLRNWIWVLLVCSVASASVTSTIGILGWTDIVLAPVIGFVPNAVLSIAVADVIHLLILFRLNLHQGLSRTDAMRNSFKDNFRAITLTTITTIIGFMCLNFGDSPPYRLMGNVIALGVLLAYLFALLLIPILAIRFNQDDDLSRNFLDKLTENMAVWVLRKKKLITIIFFGLTAYFAYQALQNNITEDLTQWHDKRYEYRQDMDFLSEQFKSVHRIYYSVNTSLDTDIYNPELLNFVESFSEYLKTQPSVTQVNSILPILKKVNQEVHGGKKNWYRTPENSAESAQLLLLYEMSLPQGHSIDSFVSSDRDSVSMTVLVKRSKTSEILALKRDIELYLEQHVPAGIQVDEATGIDILFSNIAVENSYSMLKGTLVALFLVSLLIGVALRSAKYGLVSLLPNIFPAILAFGVWGLFVGEIGLATSVVVSMALGIIVDDTVHFIDKYFLARKFKQYSPEAAVSYAFKSVGAALIITTCILLGGFITLIFSGFIPTRDIGILLSSTIVFALLINLLLLPPILTFIDDDQQHSEVATDKTEAGRTIA